MVAHLIASAARPALVLAPNKTLAAQLCSELAELFPANRVEFFVSHFSFYQPEAYLASSDKYIAKASAIDKRIDQLRHAATRSLFERSDTIVVATVSSIYGLGLPSEYLAAALRLAVGTPFPSTDLSARLRELGYSSGPAGRVQTTRGLFHVDTQLGKNPGPVTSVSGDDDITIDLSPPWEPEGMIYRITLRAHNITHLQSIDTTTNTTTDLGPDLVIYPARHFVLPRERLDAVIASIEAETAARVKHFQSTGRPLEASRLQERVRTDVHLIRTVGHCAGMENYSMHLSGRPVGAAPKTLLDYLPNNGRWLLVVDESHVTLPQLAAMHAGNAARKKALIHHGFRLPSAMENRPLSAKEFWTKVRQTVFVSATPGPEELRRSGPSGIVEALIRPTGIVDPTVTVVPTRGQIEHLTRALARVARQGGKAVVTTITKRFAEDLAECLSAKAPVPDVLDRRLRVAFLHSGIDSVGRMQVLEAMRGTQVKSKGEKTNGLDVVVGVNLLREGIDLPAVQLVAILDADSQGFLRGETALIQTIGRAARNVHGHVIMYADTRTSAMEHAIGETGRRRRLQMAFNELHKKRARPVGSVEACDEEEGLLLLNRIRKLSAEEGKSLGNREFGGADEGEQGDNANRLAREEASRMVIDGDDVDEIRKQMFEAAEVMDFETAALLRDRLDELGAA